MERIAWCFPYASNKDYKYVPPIPLGRSCFSLSACLRSAVEIESKARATISTGVVFESYCWPADVVGIISINFADADSQGLFLQPTFIPTNFNGELKLTIFNFGNLNVIIDPGQILATLQFIATPEIKQLVVKSPPLSEFFKIM